MWEMMNYNKNYNPNEDKMLYVKGSKQSYRCDCRCNVFRQIGQNPKRYRCNSCRATFTGE